MKKNNAFDEGYESGKTAALTEVENILVKEGFNPEEVTEMLYDPAPKKGRKKTEREIRKGSRTKRVMLSPNVHDQVCSIQEQLGLDTMDEVILVATGMYLELKPRDRHKKAVAYGKLVLLPIEPYRLG